MPQTRASTFPTIADALDLLRQGRWQEAERLLAGLAERGNVKAMELAGKVALRDKRFDAAKAWCRMALESGETMDRLNDMGVALAASGAGDEAAVYYQKAIGANPASPVPYCNMGRMLHARGKLGEAADFLRRAVEKDPDYAQGQLYYGITLMDAGDMAAARKALEQAVRLWPDNPLSHIYLGKVLDACGDPAAAIKCCQDALKLDPDHVIALADMGGLLFRLGEADKALNCFQRYLVRHPGHAGMLNNCGLMRMQQGKWEEAIRYFRQALSGPQPFAGAMINLGSAQQLSGQRDAALATFKSACEKMPQNPQAFSGLAETELTQGHPEAAYKGFLRAVELAPNTPEYYRRLVAMGRLFPIPQKIRDKLAALEADSGEMPDIAVADLHFALYQLKRDAHDYDEAGRHLIAANAARRKTVAYKEEDSVRLYQRIVADTPAELFAQKAGLGDPSELPVFIVGMPRSGTSLLEQILASHRDVFGAGELSDFGTVVGSRPNDVPDCDPAHLSGGDLQILARRYLKRLLSFAPDAKRIINKLPWNCFMAGYIHLLLPNARILYIERDAMDCCLSCYEQNFRGALDFSYDPRELGHYYRICQKMMDHWRAVLPEGVICTVSYEQLVGNFEPETRRVLDFCGLDWDPACLDFYKSKRAVMTASVMQVRQPLYASAIGRWQRFGATLAPLQAALAEDFLP